MKSMTPVPSRSKVVTFGVTAIVLIISTIGLLPAKTMSGTIVVDNAVTFYENDYIGDSVMEPQTAGSEVALTLFGSLLVKFSNPGYTFDYWTTNSNGSGTKYTDGELYNFALGNMDLYAQWKPNQVRFDENATLNDSVDCVESASTTTALTPFSDLNPTFSKPGYVFDGWSTSPSGAGVAYADGSTYDFTLGSMTLYAQWSAATYSVSYSAGGGTASATSASYTTGGNSITLPSASQSGYTFDGWFSAAQGGNLIGLGGASFTPTSSTTLFAQWTAIPSFDVTFSVNGGVGTVGPVSALSGATFSLPSPSTMSRPGYVFTGWNTVADGSGTAFGSSSTMVLSGPMTLYAQWRQLPAASVRFVLNGARGSVPAISAYNGAVETLPSPPALARPGYIFTGWNTRANGTGSMFASGVSMTLGASLTLYAQWSGHAPARLVSPIGPFATAHVGVAGSLVAQVDRLASLIIRQQRHIVTLYGYPSTAATAQAGIAEGRARVSSVAAALRRALTHAHHGGVRLVVVDEGPAAGSSNRVSVVVR